MYDAYTSIDFIQTSKKEVDNIVNSLRGPKMLTDDAWVDCVFTLDVECNKEISGPLIQSDIVQEQLNLDIKNYLRLNNTSHCPYTILWNALKAYMEEN